MNKTATREGEVMARRAPSESRTVARHSAIVAMGTLVSRVTGLGRVLAIAGVLGPTFLGNLFQTANVLPNLLFELFVGALVASLVVPPLVRRIDRGDPEAVGRFANGFLGVAMLGFALLVVTVAVLSPLLVRLLAIGIAEADIRAAYVRLGLPLVALLLPQVFVYALASTANAVQHAHGRFALSSAAPAIENIGVIITVLLAGARYGTGLSITDADYGLVIFLGVGTTVSAVAHGALQWWGARRVGVTLRPTAGWRDPEIRQLGRMALPSVGWTVLNFVRLFGPLIVLGGIAGAVVAFQLALNFAHAIVALGSRAMAMALLPVLSRLVHDGDLEGFAREHRRGVDLSLFVILPTALLLGALAWAVAPVVAVGSMNTEVGIRLCAVALAGLAPAIVGDGLFTIGTNSSYATRDARTPFVAMVLRILMMATGLTLGFVAFDGIRVLAMTAATISLSDLFASWFLHYRLGGHTSFEFSRSRMLTLGASVAGAATALIATLLAGPIVPGLVLVGAAGAAGVSIYLMIQGLSGSPQLRHLLR